MVRWGIFDGNGCYIRIGLKWSYVDCMNKAKKLFKYLSFLMLFVTVWVLLNSIDDSSYNDLGILSNLKSVSDDENGYVVISYLNNSKYKMFDDRLDADRLKRHIEGSEWDQAFVDEVLSEHGKIITDIEAVINKPYFKFPDYESISDIAEYVQFMNASRILILRSIDQANNGNIDEAIEMLITNLKYNQRLKNEENSTLISHMVGLVMQGESVKWLHRFLQFEKIDAKALKKLHAAMDHVGVYEEDGFKKVFYGEFNFAVLFFEEIKAKSIKQRLDDYSGSIDVLSIYRPGILEVVQAFIPYYFYHPNEVLSQRAPLMKQLAGQTQNYCNAITFAADKQNPSWFSALSPNSLSEQWVDMGTVLYKDYFYRRCLSHIYYDSVRSFIGIRQYMLEKGGLPDSLEQLTPKYLKRLPIDYFNGETLNYSKEKGWLYSVGTTFENNNGSEDSIYYGRCMNSEPCYESPTVLIVPR